jgi:glycosyltransferase involved in cell wall biosynthesis
VTLFSVIIPTYERTDLLIDRAIASVRRQVISDLEINVVSDGMVGSSLEDLEKRLDGIGDARIRLWPLRRQRYPEDPGQRWCVLGLNARNHGLDVSEGEWIAPLDDDDEWTDDHLETLLDAAKKNHSDFAYGISQYHWPDGRLQFAGRWPPGMGAFCDGAQIYRNGLGYRYDPRCVERGLPEDGDLWTRMWEAGVKFTFRQVIVHHYYPNPR